MRAAGYVTMLDPLQNVFGKRWGSFLFFPALAGELLWSASVLAALGSSLAVMLRLDQNISVLVSAAITVSYTMFGGLASVAYTDVVQLFCIFIGLVCIENIYIDSKLESFWSINYASLYEIKSK